jgi:hypothetical protein
VLGCNLPYLLQTGSAKAARVANSHDAILYNRLHTTHVTAKTHVLRCVVHLECLAIREGNKRGQFDSATAFVQVSAEFLQQPTRLAAVQALHDTRYGEHERERGKGR